MTKYESVSLLKDVAVPGQPPKVRFTAPEFELTRDGDVVTIHHVASGAAVDVPLAGVWHAVRVPTVAVEDVAATVTAKRGKKS